MKIKKLPFEEFKNIYSKVPRLCVEVVIKTEKGFLLTKRTIPPLKGCWHIPGGTVLKGEKLRDAVKRVAKEELNVEVKVGEVLGVIEYSIKNYFSHPVGIAFTAEITSGNLRLDDNSDEIKFFRNFPDKIFKEQRDFLEKL